MKVKCFHVNQFNLMKLNKTVGLKPILVVCGVRMYNYNELMNFFWWALTCILFRFIFSLYPYF